MTWLSDTTQLVAPNWLSSAYRGHGIRGGDVPTSGTDGGSPVVDDLLFPADTDTELRWNITTLPIDGTLQVFEDLTYIWTPVPGTVNASRFFNYSLLAFSTPLYTDTEIIVLGTGDYTQVSRDQALAYSVLSGVQQDRSLAWLVRAAVQADRAIAWAVLSGVTADRTFSWSLRSAVQADQPLSWSVLVDGQVVSDQAISWAVRNAVQRDASLAWVNYQSAVADRSINWVVDAPSGAGTVTSDQPLSWIVRAAVMRDRSLAWAVSPTGIPPRLRLRVTFTQIPGVLTRVAR